MAEQTDEEKILENAMAPKSASGDSGSMEQHSIDDQIKAARFAASQRAARASRPGIRTFKFVPPGAS